MNFLYFGCSVYRDTSTTTVSFILFDTTIPWNNLPPLCCSFSAFMVLRAPVKLGENARDFFSCITSLFDVPCLASRNTKTELPERLTRVVKHFHQVFFSFFFYACHTYSSRLTTLLLSGSLAPALRSASFATASLTPSISNNTRPGNTSATYPTGSPLPLPMPTSAAFAV